MSWFNRTYRIVDGERIEGTWRHGFIKNGDTYYLTDLKIYADGLIDCWGLVDLEGLKAHLARGWVATKFVEGASASAHQLANWRFHEAQTWITPDDFLREIADEIARLRGEPTSETRCIEALNHYVKERTEANQAKLRDAYLAVPEHNRIYLLGDQDVKDMPIRVLAVPVGQVPLGSPINQGVDPVTEEWRDEMFAYFADREAANESWKAMTNNNDPDGPRDEGTDATTIDRFGGQFGGAPGWMKLEGNAYLSNDAPIPVVLDGVEYPSATHAYWAMSISDDAARLAIKQAPNPFEARRVGSAAARRQHWPEMRLAMMGRVVRAKFRQHPELAARLMATGTARLLDGASSGGRYWGAGTNGRNWLGRVLEMVRSELSAAAVGENEGDSSRLRSGSVRSAKLRAEEMRWTSSCSGAIPRRRTTASVRMFSASGGSHLLRSPRSGTSLQSTS